MKILSKFLIFFVFVGTASAAIKPDQCCSNKVISPLYAPALYVSLTGLYWQSLTELDYALTDSTTFENVIARELHSIKPNYDWGLKAEVAYQFPCTSYDVGFAVTNYRNNTSDTLFNELFFPDTSFSSVPVSFGDISVEGSFTSFGTTVSGVFVLIPGAQLGETSVPVNTNSISANQHFKNCTWDLDVGKKINVGNHLQLHLFSGIKYSQLEHSLDAIKSAIGSTTVDFEDVIVEGLTADPAFGNFLIVQANPTFDLSANVADTINQKSKYSGIGPWFGLDATVPLIGNLNAVASLSSSLLIGESKNSYFENLDQTTTVILTDLSLFVNFPAFPLIPFDIDNVSPTVFNNSTTQEFIFQFPNETKVVPNIDAKIGLEYNCCFPNNSNRVTIEGGYLISHYYNPVERVEIQHLDTNSIVHQNLDISFRGPYLKLSMAFL